MSYFLFHISHPDAHIPFRMGFKCVLVKFLRQKQQQQQNASQGSGKSVAACCWSASTKWQTEQTLHRFVLVNKSPQTQLSQESCETSGSIWHKATFDEGDVPGSFKETGSGAWRCDRSNLEDVPPAISGIRVLFELDLGFPRSTWKLQTPIREMQGSVLTQTGKIREMWRSDMRSASVKRMGSWTQTYVKIQDNALKREYFPLTCSDMKAIMINCPRFPKFWNVFMQNSSKWKRNSTRKQTLKNVS